MPERPHHIVYLALIAAFMLPACDNTVDPFIDTGRFATIWGYLDTASDTQFVRVIPFRKDVGGLGDAEVDVDVTIEEAETGRTIAWRDSVVAYADGSLGHVFYAPFRPIPGFTYRFLARRSDGVEGRATTVVPNADDAHVQQPDLFALAGITQVVTWDDVDVPPFRVEVWYRFAQFPPYEPFKDVVLTYDDIGIPMEKGWRVVVQLSEDADVARSFVNSTAQLLGVGMRLTMSDDAWRPPGGVFDEEILVQPGTFSNVENGYGFLGSVNHYTVEWVLSDLVTRRLEFNVPG